MASLACAQQTKARIAEGFDAIQVTRLEFADSPDVPKLVGKAMSRQ